MLIIDKCKEKRTLRNMKNTRIAELTELPLSTVNSFFSGCVKNPSLLTTVAICKVLGQSLDSVYGIVDEDMSQAEIERIRSEYKKNEAELHNLLEEHAKSISVQEVKICGKDEVIRRQDIRMGELKQSITRLEDRVRSQKVLIRIDRVIIVTLTVVWIWVDLSCPEYGVIRKTFLDFIVGMFG